MPEVGGLDVCRSLRRRGDAVPVLVVTARDAISDRVEGLDAGADDYLVKPFAVEELIARLHALTRRGSGPVRSYADLTLDPVNRRVTRGGQALELTGREAELLEILLRSPGQLVSRELAIAEIWNGAAEPNVVDRYITRLRRKLGDPPLIQTVRGAGFTLRA